MEPSFVFCSTQAQRGLVPPVVAIVDGPPRPPSVQWPRARPAGHARKGSGKGLGRSQPAPHTDSSSGAVSDHTRQACGIRRRSRGEVGQVGARIVVSGCRVSRGQLKSMIDKTRVRAGQCHPGSTWSVQASVWSWPNKQWSPQWPSRNVCKRSTTLGPQGWRS